jgi:hypothetical protein
MSRFLFLVVLTLLLVACSPAPTETPLSLSTVTVAPQPLPATNTPNLCLPCGRAAATMTARIPATQTMEAMQATQTFVAPTVRAEMTGTAAARVTPDVAATQGCDAFPCLLEGHFLFQPPIGPAGKQSIERSYPYGGTQRGTREAHHGVEFYNPQGTPVLAAADGTVVFAGNDKLALLAWMKGFYGNVVVLEHHFPGFAQPLYTLYGHLYHLNVTVGQEVKAGDPIGEVGATGTAIGSHLHFEVRVAANDYKSNRNPELWLVPFPDTGVLAGRITDATGALRKGTVNVQRIKNGVLDADSVATAEAYTYDAQPVNGDDIWHENFAFGGLPAGDYRLTLLVEGSMYEQLIKIEPGRLTLVRFFLKN